MSRIGSVRGPTPARHRRKRAPRRATNRPRRSSIAVIGRPNAGKSSLVNRLLREERMLVSEMPGTTRDAVDTLLKWHKRDYRIVDTAGIRRAGRVGTSGPLESLSVLVARRAIQHADVVVMVIDASQGATDQDAAIAGEADRLGCGIVIAANKWDLMKQHGPDFYKEFDEKLRDQLKFLDYAPVMHISATTGERTPKLLETVDKVAAARMKRVPTPELNRFVRDVTAAASAGEPHPQTGADSVCGSDQRGAAYLRVLHQRRDVVPLLVSALPAESAAREIRFRRHAASHRSASPLPQGRLA